MAPVVGEDPAAFDEEIGERPVLASAPDGAGLDELRGVDEIGLQGEHPEEQVAVGVHVVSFWSAAIHRRFCFSVVLFCFPRASGAGYLITVREKKQQKQKRR